MSGKGYAQWTATGDIFPASGYRNNNDAAQLLQVGNAAYYWSSSAQSNSYNTANSDYNSYFMAAGIQGDGFIVLTGSDYYLYRQMAFPVRCIKTD
jgi:hypothetical protein